MSLDYSLKDIAAPDEFTGYTVKDFLGNTVNISISNAEKTLLKYCEAVEKLFPLFRKVNHSIQTDTDNKYIYVYGDFSLPWGYEIRMKPHPRSQACKKVFVRNLNMHIFCSPHEFDFSLSIRTSEDNYYPLYKVEHRPISDGSLPPVSKGLNYYKPDILYLMTHHEEFNQQIADYFKTYRDDVRLFT